MSVTVVILAILIISLVVMASFLIFKWKLHDSARYLPSVAEPTYRKLNADEYQAIECYLNRVLPPVVTDRINKTSWPILMGKNDMVYTICHSITRFSVASDERHSWRYYIDMAEIHLPFFLEPFIKQQNIIDVVHTATIPLVVSINGHFLKDFQQDFPSAPVISDISHQQASIQKNGETSVKLQNIRKETLEEYRLNHSSGIWEGGFLCFGFFIWFLALLSPALLLPWLMLIAGSLVVVSFWPLLCPLSICRRQDIHCLTGIPKRWGLFGEFEQGQMSNISLGGIDLIYPPHWEPYVAHYFDQKTNIDIYTNGQVVRQGHYLSLHDEEKNYPYRRYGKNLMMIVSCLLIMLLLYFYQPVSVPMKLSFAWLRGSITKVITDVDMIEGMELRVGDILKAKGIGMCYMPPNNMNGKGDTYFSPLDCSGIYWNRVNPLPIPESEIIENAAKLIATVNKQLRLQENDDVINPDLTQEIFKSSMILLEDFSDIVLKTKKLCEKETDCLRLKNALVNLGSAIDWLTLLKNAESGKLDGIHVLLRPAGAEALGKLVDATTSSFIYREIDKVAMLLNSPSPGGVLLISDEGKQLVEYITPAIISYDHSVLEDHSALEQWRELQRLSDMVLQTPFETTGIVMELSVDSNGTRRIVLHSELDTMTLARCIGTTILFLALFTTLIINFVLVIKKNRQNKQRINKISQYYDNCFNTLFPPTHWR
ncbi:MULTISPECIES: intracellular growth attenuator family protein [Photorhabdus]|uniref:Intracellular growth attenuator protein igaA n=2 Tax=Photorhabdus TaxID=29487 RepID=A0ABX0B1Y4_9GAMM|nr:MULTISPECIES: intracellular growth attenuator family protein [Photorhabdus]MCC8374860.1 intracellular growth attenuator family protein [Photorhabdus bodei]MCC8465103.1 intracellular growth attenuator family protein [Photorhabdus bodei]MCT8352866.1 intracellular growth attenuator family protein [Photorhabdus kayaii]MDB6369018.1 intracellular growth attenuator family protein [Photorhabdus bodei]MDB6372083.1 intracellular growth attenuator family protein [Photorhabdus bodei]